MNLMFIISVILKGIGAVLEILLQILVTGQIGVGGYGTYSAWINGADLLFWVFFSGLVKCNTFYLSGKASTLSTFKRKYYLRYALPVLGVLMLAAAGITGNGLICFVFVITLLELTALDRSSTLLARGRSNVSLIGEYVLGRVMLVVGVLVLSRLGWLRLESLLCLYVLQYLTVIGFFLLRQGKSPEACPDVSGEVSLKKWGAFQQADLMHAMIEQMPVVLQFFFSGAFEAGVVSIVLLVKKLINFISGPTAKIFLPEFSRLYHDGKHEEIRNCYSSIMRIQMLIVGPLAVVLLAYPRVILRILASELVEYDWLFMLCSVVFLLVATLGPCGGILQMTGNERNDNRCRVIALGVMGAVMVLTIRDSYFVLYGLCVQVALEAVLKYRCVCHWMGQAPVALGAYLRWWLVPCGLIGMSWLLGLGEGFLWMVLTAGTAFAVALWKELRADGGAILNKIRKK